jgi:hypothetical protein
MSKIYYFCPDYTMPSGGTRTIYRHVAQLNRKGIDAAIVHRKRGFDLDWLDIEVPVVYLDDSPPITGDDVLVFAEGLAPYMKVMHKLQATQLVLALNWVTIYPSLPEGESWRDYGIQHVITPSKVVQRFVEWSMELPTTLIEECVDPGTYAYQPERKQAKISFMTRKDRFGEVLHRILEDKEAVFGGYEWVALLDMTEQEYAAQLAESAIYLTSGTQEGLHVSVLEAMACGNVVVGFTGIGGSDYMVGAGPEQNCYLVENGNYPELGKVLELVIREREKDPGCHDHIIRNGLVTVAHYQDCEKEAADLVAFYKELGVR